MAGRLGPRRLAERAWLRYKARKGARLRLASPAEQIELAYKTGFDAGLTKGVQRGREEVNEAWTRADNDRRKENVRALELAGEMLVKPSDRSQRHQDFILLVQMLAERTDREERRSLAATVVWAAMQVTELPDDQTAFTHDHPVVLYDYATQFTSYQYGNRVRPEWLKDVPS